MLLWADGWERGVVVGKQKREHMWPDTTLLHSCSYSPFLRPSLITTNTPRLKYKVTRDNFYSLHLLSCYLGYPLLFVIFQLQPNRKHNDCFQTGFLIDSRLFGHIGSPVQKHTPLVEQEVDVSNQSQSVYL